MSDKLSMGPLRVKKIPQSLLRVLYKAKDPFVYLAKFKDYQLNWNAVELKILQSIRTI